MSSNFTLYGALHDVLVDFCNKPFKPSPEPSGFKGHNLPCIGTRGFYGEPDYFYSTLTSILKVSLKILKKEKLYDVVYKPVSKDSKLWLYSHDKEMMNKKLDSKFIVELQKTAKLVITCLGDDWQGWEKYANSKAYDIIKLTKERPEGCESCEEDFHEVFACIDRKMKLPFCETVCFTTDDNIFNLKGPKQSIDRFMKAVATELEMEIAPSDDKKSKKKD